MSARNAAGIAALVTSTAFLSAYWGAKYGHVQPLASAAVTVASAAKTPTISQLVVVAPQPASQGKNAELPSEAAAQDPGEEPVEPTPSAAKEPAFEDIKTAALAEPRDTNWARVAEAELRRKTEGLLAEAQDATLGRISCGSTRCVLEMTAKTSSFSSLNLPRHLGVRLGRAHQLRTEDGGYRFEVLTAREGYNVLGQPVPPSP